MRGRTKFVYVCLKERKIERGRKRERGRARERERESTSPDGTLRQRKCAGSPSARPDFLIRDSGERKKKHTFRAVAAAAGWNPRRKKHAEPRDTNPHFPSERLSGRRATVLQRGRCNF